MPKVDCTLKCKFKNGNGFCENTTDESITIGDRGCDQQEEPEEEMEND